MRVAVYAIAKDEQDNVEGWAASAEDADLIMLADTGSTDRTQHFAMRSGVDFIAPVVISPWRFDDARNAALAMIPADVDVCVSLDLDERLQPGWRPALEEAWRAGIDRPTYRYVWNWAEDGSEGIVFARDHIHARRGFRWHHPVHETLVRSDGGSENRQFVPGIEVHQHGDESKDRSSYLPLLELALAEDPTDDRNQHYLGREYLHSGMWDRAEAMLLTHLANPRSTWAAERSRSMRLLAETIRLRRWEIPGGILEVEQWLLRACAEAPDYREPWLALARHYYRCELWREAAGAASRGLQVQTRQLDYLTDTECWAGEIERLEVAALSRIAATTTTMV